MPIVDSINLPTGVLSAGTSEPAGVPVSGIPNWGSSIQVLGQRPSADIIPPVFDDEYVYPIAKVGQESVFGFYWAYFMAKVSQRTRQIEWIRELPRINASTISADAFSPSYAHESGVYVAGGNPQGSKLYRLNSAGDATQLNYLTQRNYNVYFTPTSTVTSLDNLTISTIGEEFQTEIPFIPPTPTQAYWFTYPRLYQGVERKHVLLLPSGSQVFGLYVNFPFNIKIYQNNTLIHDVNGDIEYIFDYDDGAYSHYYISSSGLIGSNAYYYPITGPIPQAGSSTSSTTLRFVYTVPSLPNPTPESPYSITFNTVAGIVSDPFVAGQNQFFDGYEGTPGGSRYYYRYSTSTKLYSGGTYSTNNVSIPTGYGTSGQLGRPSGTNYYDIKINTLNNNVSATNIFFSSATAYNDGLDACATDGISNYYVGRLGNQFFIQKRNAITSGPEALWYYPLYSSNYSFIIKYYNNYLYVVQEARPQFGGTGYNIYKIDRANGSIVDQKNVFPLVSGRSTLYLFDDLSTSFYIFEAGYCWEYDFLTGELANDPVGSDFFLPTKIENGESWTTFSFTLDYDTFQLVQTSAPNTLNRISLGSQGWTVGQIGI
jgi:hypothetical protein